MFKRIIMLLSYLGLPVITMAASHNPQQILDSIRGQADEGQQIVQLFCSNCHAEKALIELGAPKPGQSGEWKSRMKQGLETLFQHTAEGFGAMPARGGCFECTDEQLRLAIIAMLPDELVKLIKKAES